MAKFEKLYNELLNEVKMTQPNIVRINVDSVKNKIDDIIAWIKDSEPKVKIIDDSNSIITMKVPNNIDGPYINRSINKKFQTNLKHETIQHIFADVKKDWSKETFKSGL